METVVGIDGGGTKTAAVILNQQGRILGYGEGGPSTFGVVPLAVTEASIMDAVHAAVGMAAAGGTSVEPANFAAACIGLGNVVSEKDRAAVHQVALQLCLAESSRIRVDHDIRVALAGGLSGRPGIVMIAGTGTSCFGINSDGASWRSGGWGPLIDDEGSSYWFGIQAMRAAVLDYDGRGPRTLLTQSICERLAIGHMEELMNRLYAAEMTRTEIASLAPLVFDAAAKGDPAAQGLIDQGCRAMAGCVLAVARKLGLAEGTSELAITGGLTNAGAALLVPFQQAVLERLPACQVKEAELIPAIGAALLALQKAGIPQEDRVIEVVKTSGRALGLVR